MIKFRGCIAVVSETVDKIATRFLNDELSSFENLKLKPASDFHVTLLTKDELTMLGPQVVSSALLLSPDSITPLGVGGTLKTSLFVVVVWPKGQAFRISLGLPSKQFHITLTEQNSHTIDKGFKSLHNIRALGSLNLESLDATAHQLMLENEPALSLDLASNMVLKYSDSPRGFVRMGISAMALGQYKLGMLSFANVLQWADSINEKLLRVCLSNLAKCATHTEWGLLFLENELLTIPKIISHLLLTPWSEKVWTLIAKSQVNKDPPTLTLSSRERLCLPAWSERAHSGCLYELPRFFRWIVPFVLAGMSTPRNAMDIKALAKIGIKFVLTLTEEEPLPEAWFWNSGVKNLFLPVPNYHPPTNEQLDLFMELITNPENQPMLVHCGGGKGRAGTVIACYTLAFGYAPPPSSHLLWENPVMTAKDAISRLRHIRPGSIETEHQEVAISGYCSLLWKRQSLFHRVEEPVGSDTIEMQGDVKSADLLILCGLPGSGKSWFSQAIQKRNHTWTIICSDEIGRNGFETAIGRQETSRAILDRCTNKPSDRAWFLSLATWAKNPVAVWFDYPPELCVYRANRRNNHPSLTPGSRVLAAIQQQEAEFVPPTLSEQGGFFKGIARITSFESSRKLVELLSPPIQLLKFPRTPHLLNLGAMGDDDITIPAVNRVEGNSTTIITITEKIDGANMGFSLSSSRAIVVQNRSHYVNPTSHVQFKKLGKWVEDHHESLHRILDRDDQFPQRFILYGEWMAATHSISYDNLPSLFIAFDLYDRFKKTFVDRATLSHLLTGTGIGVTPLLFLGACLPPDNELVNMVQQKSSFYSGRVEGIYLKWEAEGVVMERAKIVRGDFLSGNTHWSKGIISFNLVKEEQ